MAKVAGHRVSASESVHDEADEDWDAEALHRAERLFSAADRLGIFVSVLSALALIGDIVLAVTTKGDARGVVLWAGLISTAFFWLTGQVVSRAGCAYATDLTRRVVTDT